MSSFSQFYSTLAELYYISSPSILQVRIIGARATVAFLLAQSRETSLQRHFAELLPAVLQAAVESVKAGEDDTLLKVFIELEETVPRILRPLLEPILTLSIQVSAVLSNTLPKQN